jgi:hypothetical protein
MQPVSNLKCFAIVIKNNFSSEYYFKKILPVWNSINIYPTRFEAITPDNLPDGPLYFRKNYAHKYTKIKGKEFTSTEKACFYSHFLLWQKCIKLNEKILVIEHDTAPFNPSRLFYKKENWFRSYDFGAMGCYVIDPFFAKIALNRILAQGVCSGPLGELQHFFCGRFRNSQHSFVVNNKQDIFFNTVNKNYVCATSQIFHSSYSTTIQHNLNEPDPIWPYHLRIENAPEILTIDWLKTEALKFEYGQKSLNNCQDLLDS